MNYKFYLAVIIFFFSLQSFSQIGISGVAYLNLQNASYSHSQLSYFGNTDFRFSPTFSLCINRPKLLHLINLSAQFSNVRILDSGYFETYFLSFGYTRLKPKNIFGTEASVGYGLDISTSVGQTRSTFLTRTTIEEGGFGEIIKFTPYFQTRLPLFQANSGYQSIMDFKAGIDIFGISNGNGVYTPMYFCSVGFGSYKNLKNKKNK